MINIEIYGLDQNKIKMAKKLLHRIPFTDGNQYTAHFSRSAQIEIHKSGNDFQVSYCNDCEIGRCLLNIALMIQEKSDEPLTETEYFDTKGVMLDMSRAGVMKTEKVREYMEYMSLLGLNTLMLYMEDVFELDGYEYFGYLRGRYSKEELRQMDDYGQELGIEVIPCIQTLGHFEQFNKWKQSEEIKDTATVLKAESEKTYAFLEEIIRTMSECFRTKRIHIGMDEAWDLGLGKYLKENGYKEGTEIFCEHIRRVKQITDKYGLEPMIWSDMFFRLISKDGSYYDLDVEVDDKVREALPAGINLVYWDYTHEEPETYIGMIKKHKKLTDRISFAGGIRCWEGFIPRMGKSFRATDMGLTVCKQEHIRDFFATVWGDDGCETDYMFTLPVLILYGEHAYRSALSEKRTESIMQLLFGISVEDVLRLGDIQRPLAERDLTIKQILWSDPLVNMSEADMAEESFIEFYSKQASYYQSLAHRKDYGKIYFSYIALICEIASRKIRLTIDLRKGYETDEELLKKLDFAGLRQCFSELKKIHYDMWNTTYKPYGFEIVDMRYGGKIARIETAERRVSDYLSGKIEKIEELHDKKLPFGGQQRLGAFYSSMSSPFIVRGYC